MTAPERVFTPEFFETEPPIYPVKFKFPKGRGRPSPKSLLGWDGFKLTTVGGKLRVVSEPDMGLKHLADGYAEIPATKYNKDLLSILSKPRQVKATYDRGLSVDKVDPTKFWFRDNKGVPRELTQEAIDDNLIRVVEAAYELPPCVESLPTRREFDVNNPRLNDSETCQKVRPWLKDYIKVQGAQMEAAII